MFASPAGRGGGGGGGVRVGKDEDGGWISSPLRRAWRAANTECMLSRVHFMMLVSTRRWHFPGMPKAVKLSFQS